MTMTLKALFLLSAAALVLPTDPVQSQELITVISYNIRFDNPADGDNVWERRKEDLAATIRFQDPDIAGLQEALIHQMEFIASVLPEYGWFGVGRDDGAAEGEIMAVLFKKKRFDTVSTATLWCSETPGKPGIGWDAVCRRTITIGTFYDSMNRDTLYLFNTHLDHVGETARLRSVELLRNTIDGMTHDHPVIVTGDFNSTPRSVPYQRMIDRTHRRTLYDSRTISVSGHHGPKGTFTGFDIHASPDEPIDYIFVSDNIAVRRHAVISEMMNGRFPSDHFPVAAEIMVRKGR